MQSKELFELYPRIRLIVKALPKHEVVKYGAPVTCVTLDVMWPDEVDAQLARAERLLADVVAAGDDVLVHCRQSFHRGPIAGAALMRRLSGVPVLDRLLKRVVRILKAQ